jgi:quercetin dioxygenase-like cupin family protein
LLARLSGTVEPNDKGGHLTIATSPEPEPASVSVSVFGTAYTIKMCHPTYAIIEQAGEPGSGLPPHSLEAQDQSIYVISGEYQLVIGDERQTLSSGSVGFIPQGTIHSLTVSSAEAGRCLAIVSPRGALESFLEDAQPADDLTTWDAIYQLARLHGIALLTQPV